MMGTATAVPAKTTFQLRMILISNFLFRRRGMALESLVRRLGFASGAAFPQLLDHRIEDGNERKGADGGGKHTAEYGWADGLAARRTRPRRQHQRHDAKNESEGRHE